MKTVVLLASAAVVAGGYVGAWVWAWHSANYEALLVLVRAGLIAIGLMTVAIVAWWMRYRRTFGLRTLVIGGPIFAALLAVPLPYYSHGRSVQRKLQRAGVDYRVQASGFSKTLQQLCNDLFSLNEPNLFASQLTFVRINLDSVQTEQLLQVNNCRQLEVVEVLKSQVGQKLTDPLVAWLNALPSQTRVIVTLYKANAHDLDQLRSIRHPLAQLTLTENPTSPTAIRDAIACEPENLYLFGVTFPRDFGHQVQSETHPVNMVRLQQCSVPPSQLPTLAATTQCRTLNCDTITTSLSVDDCQRLANMIPLDNLNVGTLPLNYERLQPLMVSPQLKTFMATADKSVTPMQVNALRDAIPEGYNRRVRVDHGIGIAIGDVGTRRGQ